MEIAIVGAGPAGAMAAIRLARAGVSVTLFDPSHPREKPCGGGVTGRALALVADIVDIAALPAVVVRSAIVEAPATVRLKADTTDTGIPVVSGFSRTVGAKRDTSVGSGYSNAHVALVDRGLTPDSSLVVLSRAVFDKALVDAAVRAGTRLIPEKVIDIARRGRTMILRTSKREYSTDFLIGADGANSLVRKKLARPFLRSEMSIAAGFFVHGARSSDIAVACMAEQPGYLWSFPRPDHLAIGICTPATERASSATLRVQASAWIRSHGLANGTRLAPYAWPIPSVGFDAADRVEASGPGWLLLGDAAGLVDPLTREGIYYALLSGHWAAEALATSAARADVIYEDRLREEIYPELNRAARLCALFFSPAFSTLFVTALRQSAPIREVFANLVAGTQPYTGLRRRLLATQEWRLAGRAALMMVQSRPSFSCVIPGYRADFQVGPRS